MRVATYKPGDRVRVPVSGWTGVVVRKSDIRSNGYLVRWDEDATKDRPYAAKESWVRPLNLEHE